MWVYVYEPDQGHIYTTGDTGGVQNERDRNGYIYRSGVNMYEYFIIHIYMRTYNHGVYVQDIEERVDR